MRSIRELLAGHGPNWNELKTRPSTFDEPPCQHKWKITHQTITGKGLALRCRRCPATATADVALNVTLTMAQREAIIAGFQIETPLFMQGQPGQAVKV